MIAPLWRVRVGPGENAGFSPVGVKTTDFGSILRISSPQKRRRVSFLRAKAQIPVSLFRFVSVTDEQQLGEKKQAVAIDFKTVEHHIHNRAAGRRRRGS